MDDLDDLDVEYDDGGGGGGSGSFSGLSGAATMRGAVLIGIAVLLGVVLLGKGFDSGFLPSASGDPSDQVATGDGDDGDGDDGSGDDGATTTEAPPTTRVPAEVRVQVLNSAAPGQRQRRHHHGVPLGPRLQRHRRHQRRRPQRHGHRRLRGLRVRGRRPGHRHQPRPVGDAPADARAAARPGAGRRQRRHRPRPGLHPAGPGDRRHHHHDGGLSPRTLPADPLEVLRADPSSTVVASDFDGTLAPIVDDPGAARPQAGAVEALESLAGRYAVVAVLSGRPVSFLEAHLPPVVQLHGLYGLEVLRGGVRVEPPGADQLRAAVGRAARDASERLPDRVLVEDKGLSLTIHFRTSTDDALLVQAAAEALGAEHGLLGAPGPDVRRAPPAGRRRQGLGAPRPGGGHAGGLLRG